MGELGQDGSPSQIDSVVTSAVAVASDEEQRVRLGILRTRVALKRLQFAMAARLADSTLARAPVTGSLQHLRSISALYALRGRAEDAAKAMERAADVEATRADASQRTAQGLRREVARLTVFAAVGMRDSIAASVERVEMQMQQWIPPQQQAAWRDAALTQPAALASSSLGRLVEWSPRPAGRYLLALRYDADRGNATGVRARLAALDRARAAYRPSDISLDAVVSEARARLDIGDTTAAVASLDGAIRSLPARLGSLLRDASSAASLVQLMRLRGAVGGPTAARWRAAADTLWSR
ncbi:MAG: hypothetical protein MUF00_14800 [Gemmatimonadaceae bacterium]|nr:hypothetical protein [Gemmatimonadaceae bacterium]